MPTQAVMASSSLSVQLRRILTISSWFSGLSQLRDDLFRTLKTPFRSRRVWLSAWPVPVLGSGVEQKGDLGRARQRRGYDRLRLTLCTPQ